MESRQQGELSHHNTFRCLHGFHCIQDGRVGKISHAEHVVHIGCKAHHRAVVFQGNLVTWE